MAKRESVALPALNMSRDEAETQFGIYAKADANIAKINAQMDLEISKIREKNQERLAAFQTEKDAAQDKLLVFCTQNKDVLFSAKKSLEMAHGTLGFRTGTPALKPKKGFTLAACLELAKQFLPDYVRTKDELDRDALIAARNMEGIEDKYTSIGVHIVQEEKWFVELKKEEPVLS